MNSIKINSLDHDFLPVTHRALAYGDGVFETMRAINGGIIALDLHLKRLFKGATALALHFPKERCLLLEQELKQLAGNCDTEHVIKLLLLRNAVGRGYDYDPLQQTVDTVILIQPFTVSLSNRPINLGFAGNAVSENTSLAGLKHLNRLDSVLAKQSARSQQLDDCLLCTHDGYIIEATSSNAFFYIDGRWVTPAIDRAGVNGVSRERLLTAFPDEIRVRPIKKTEVTSVHSAFVCNSLTGCIPVGRLDGQPLHDMSDTNRFHEFLRGQLG